MENLWKNVKATVYEPDPVADELFNEQDNYTKVDTIEFPVFGDDWRFNTSQIYYALLAHHLLDEEDYGRQDALIFEADMEIGQIFIYANSPTKPVLFELRTKA